MIINTNHVSSENTKLGFFLGEIKIKSVVRKTTMFYRHKNGNFGLFCLQHENYSVFSHQIKYIYLPKVKPFIILPNNGQCHPFYVPYSNIRSEELMWSFRDSPCLSILLSPTTSILQQSFFILSPSSSARKCCMMLVGRNHHGN